VRICTTAGRRRRPLGRRRRLTIGGDRSAPWKNLDGGVHVEPLGDASQVERERLEEHTPRPRPGRSTWRQLPGRFAGVEAAIKPPGRGPVRWCNRRASYPHHPVLTCAAERKLALTFDGRRTAARFSFESSLAGSCALHQDCMLRRRPERRGDRSAARFRPASAAFVSTIVPSKGRNGVSRFKPRCHETGSF